ncbi:hypothetical protein C1645_869854 [Glomus cerebriforme]|uniref:Uncharacterized protein n=1 Tax=Glomus cerebriforme TaxID=658196 RepID=A0A397TN69_9GLOM|nr:hypothetical protein C1645_869854 [Glomus cerebriforme]
MDIHSFNSFSSSVLPEEAKIIYDRGEFYFTIIEKTCVFSIPTVSEIIATSKRGARKAPSVYIIFRKPVQKCLHTLGLKFERGIVSRISSHLWRQIKSNDPVLRGIFEQLYNNCSQRWKQNRLIIEFWKPVTEPEPAPQPDKQVSSSGDNEENGSPSVFLPALSIQEERIVLGGLFPELANFFAD